MRKNYARWWIFGSICRCCSPGRVPGRRWKTSSPASNGEVLDRSQAYETLREATTAIGHRLTGSPNGNRAETFTYNRFRQYGFRNVKYQPFQVESWMRDTVTLEIVPRNSDNFHTYRVVALAHSPVQAQVKGPAGGRGQRPARRL
jgi:hypothetical protein